MAIGYSVSNADEKLRDGVETAGGGQGSPAKKIGVSAPAAGKLYSGTPAESSESQVLSAGATENQNSGLSTGLDNGLSQDGAAQPAVPQEYGVRNVLENEFRVNGGNIGYDGTHVTLNGQKIVKPDENRDGTTYVKNKEDIVNGISEYARGNGIVAVRDYVTNKGLPVDVEWRGADGTVSLNGHTIKPMFVVDGKAYVPQSQIDAVLEKVHEDTGMQKDTDILKQSEEKYGSDIDGAYQNYMGYDDFKWNPEEDTAYQNFMNMYQKSVNDAYASNMAQAKFRTGGVMSPAAMQAAENIRRGAMDDAAVYGQQYEDRAYGRWGDSRAQAADELATAWGMMQNDYNIRSRANDKDIDNWYRNQAYQIDNVNAHHGFRMDELDYQDKLLETDMYQKYGPGMAEDESRTSRAEADDAEMAATVNKTWAMPTAEANYQSILAGNDKMRADISNINADTKAVTDQNVWNNLNNMVNMGTVLNGGVNPFTLGEMTEEQKTMIADMIKSGYFG